MKPLFWFCFLQELLSFAYTDSFKEDCKPNVKTRTKTFCGVSAEVEFDDRSASSVNIFYGIPFAQPPLKVLRFKKPQPLKENITEVLNATNHKPSCHQYNDTSYLNNPGARMWISPTSFHEDCLYLNIWVPQNEASRIQKRSIENKEKLAVMIWIYGGAFATGTAALEVYDGRYLAARQNVIVVSINYRLGPFGFIYLNNNEIPGNMGLWDQRMALKWVKENIIYFNGDPDRITLFGESAGAVSVSAHVVSPWSQNLFNNAIMQSGSVFGYWGFISKKDAIDRTKELIEKVNCKKRLPQSTIECLRQVPAETLTGAHGQMYDLKSYFSVPFPPVVEGHFFPYLESKAMNKLVYLKPSGSLLLGINKNEGSYFLLYAFIENSLWLENKTEIEIKNREDYFSKLMKVLDLDTTAPSNIFSLVDFEYTDLDLPNTTKFLVRKLEEISSDRSFKCPTIELARAVINDHRSKFGPGRRSITLPAYFYEFRYKTKALPWPSWMGTIHGSEIDYVFGVPFNKKFQSQFYQFNKEEQKISDGIMQYWANFARTGDPNIMPKDRLVSDNRRLRLWPEFDNTTESYLVINDDGSFSTSTHPKNRKCTFWRSWYPAILQETKRPMVKRCL